jgi:hypothetical protein
MASTDAEHIRADLEEVRDDDERDPALHLDRRLRAGPADRPWYCVISWHAPRPSAWNTTSSRRSKTYDSTGTYWGILNAAGEPKFPWTGPIDDGDYWMRAANGLAPSVSILRIRKPPLLLTLVLLIAASATGAWLVVAY